MTVVFLLLVYILQKDSSVALNNVQEVSNSNSNALHIKNLMEHIQTAVSAGTSAHWGESHSMG